MPASVAEAQYGITIDGDVLPMPTSTELVSSGSPQPAAPAMPLAATSKKLSPAEEKTKSILALRAMASKRQQDKWAILLPPSLLFSFVASRVYCSLPLPTLYAPSILSPACLVPYNSFSTWVSTHACCTFLYTSSGGQRI